MDMRYQLKDTSLLDRVLTLTKEYNIKYITKEHNIEHCVVAMYAVIRTDNRCYFAVAYYVLIYIKIYNSYHSSRCRTLLHYLMP